MTYFSLLHLHVTYFFQMKVCVNSCEWSSEFSVDTVGSDGSIKSIGKHDKAYEVFLPPSVMSYFIN